MPIVIRALILCDTDDADAARQAVFRAIESEVFCSDSPVLDHAIGIEQSIDIHFDSYQAGDFVSLIPSAALLETANTLPI